MNQLKNIAALFALLTAPLLLSGCGLFQSEPAVGGLRTVSLGAEPIEIDGNFITAVYSDELTSETSFYVSDIPLDDLLSGNYTTGQIIRVEMLWNPKPGKTPLDSSATNVSVRYIIFADGEVGIYEGGGFAMMHGSSFTDKLQLSVLDASLRLGESTDGFQDLLGPAQMTGKFTAQLNPQTAHKLHVLISQRVTDALGESTLVHAGDNFKVAVK